MPPVAASRGVVIGVDMLHLAKLQTDPADGTPATYDTPQKRIGTIKATINPNSSNDTLFADNGPFDVASTLGNISLELNMADLPLDWQADMLGHTLVNGILNRKSGDTPPWVAIGFRTLKSNGHYRYTWLVKGKFTQPEQSNETRGDSINWQTPTISGGFVKRDSDDVWITQADEDAPGFTQDIADNWFKSPIQTGGGTTVKTLSSVTITGTPQVGTALTANPVDAGSVAITTGITYQWAQSDTGTSGWTNLTATASSYTPAAAVQGKYVRVVVTGDGTTVTGTATSTAAGPVA